MSIFLSLIGKSGLVALIGLVTFLLIFKYSRNLFTWIERQTMGTRTYILENFELLFIDVEPDRVTYGLLYFTMGVGAFTFLLLGLGGFWLTGIVLGCVMTFLAFKVPRPVIDFMVEKRVKLYQNQMVDGLTLLANGLRAGLSVPQALGMVVSEMPKPISQEFNLILQQNKIGMTLEECFENLAKRVPTEDNDMFVTSINVLRETGGNLAETFDTIIGVIRERIRLQQKIDTYTAQGMFQGMTIASMPFALAAMYAAQDPASMKPLFTTPIGLVMLFAALALDIAGTLIIFKIVKIKI
jgi:tight adherence protein B